MQRLVLRYESFFHRYGVHTARTLTFLNILRLRSGFKLLRCRNGNRYSSLFWDVVFIGFGMVTQQGRKPVSKPIPGLIRFVFEWSVSLHSSFWECNVAGIRLFFRCDYWSHPNPRFFEPVQMSIFLTPQKSYLPTFECRPRTGSRL